MDIVHLLKCFIMRKVAFSFSCEDGKLSRCTQAGSPGLVGPACAGSEASGQAVLVRDHGFSVGGGGSSVLVATIGTSLQKAVQGGFLGRRSGLVPGGDTYPSLSLSSRRNRCGSVETAERGPVPENAEADTAEGQASSRAGREVGLPALERRRRLGERRR